MPFPRNVATSYIAPTPLNDARTFNADFYCSDDVVDRLKAHLRWHLHIEDDMDLLIGKGPTPNHVRIAVYAEGVLVWVDNVDFEQNFKAPANQPPVAMRDFDSFGCLGVNDHSHDETMARYWGYVPPEEFKAAKLRCMGGCGCIFRIDDVIHNNGEMDYHPLCFAKLSAEQKCGFVSMSARERVA